MSKVNDKLSIFVGRNSIFSRAENSLKYCKTIEEMLNLIICTTVGILILAEKIKREAMKIM